MQFKSLVVENNKDQIEDIEDRMESLEHQYQIATTQKKAKELLEADAYSYVLMNLNIPVREGRKSDVYNGIDLLRTIRKTVGIENIPVIVMIHKDQGSFDLANEIYRTGGADDIVTYPFSRQGFTINLKITDVLRWAKRRPFGVSSRDVLKPVTKFDGGELVFYKSHVELCGIVICRGGVMRSILEHLSVENSFGLRVGSSGCQLAMATGCNGGQNGISSRISDFRKHVKKEMQAQGIRIEDRDVISSGSHGYKLADKITIRHDDSCEKFQAIEQITIEDSQKKRQKWLLNSLKNNGHLTLSDASEGLRCSKATAKKELVLLRDQGKVSFKGPSRSGTWQLNEKPT